MSSRPSPVRKFTPELGREIVRYVRKGYFIQDIAALIGMSNGALCNWMIAENYAERFDDEDLRKFAADCKRARAFVINERMDRINEHAKKDWRADAWYLERRFPDQFRLTNSVQHLDKEGKPTDPPKSESKVSVYWVKDRKFLSLEEAREYAKKQKSVSDDKEETNRWKNLSKLLKRDET